MNEFTGRERQIISLAKIRERIAINDVYPYIFRTRDLAKNALKVLEAKGILQHEGFAIYRFKPFIMAMPEETETEKQKKLFD